LTRGRLGNFPPPPNRFPESPMKPFKRILLVAILALTAVGAAGYFVVRSAFPPEKVAELVREHGTKALGRDVSVEGVSLGVCLRLKVEVRGVSLAHDSGFSAEPARSLARLDFAVSCLPLLRFSPVIHVIRLVEPDILFEADASGRNNLQSLGGGESAS